MQMFERALLEFFNFPNQRALEDDSRMPKAEDKKFQKQNNLAPVS